MFDKLKELWAKYWAWIFELPDGICVPLAFATIVIPVVVGSIGFAEILNSHFKAECLDSQLARRWSPSSRICQEYHDGEWIKANLGDNIYYYNDAASREH